jgi:hypothetical protein
MNTTPFRVPLISTGGIGELSLVSVRGSVQQQHDRAFGHFLPVPVDDVANAMLSFIAVSRANPTVVSDIVHRHRGSARTSDHPFFDISPAAVSAQCAR